MVPVFHDEHCSFLSLSLSQGKWGWCESSCYEDQLIDGFEYCGNHSYCSNSDDDSRGLTCGCDTGYTAHRIYFGQKYFWTSLILRVG